MKEHILDGENGFLVDVGDWEEMARLTLGLLRNPEQALRLGAEARRRALMLGWRQCLETTCAYYEDLLAMRPQ
jgi:glycosyltransferase involved in cell wall biosynthesis